MLLAARNRQRLVAGTVFSEARNRGIIAGIREEVGDAKRPAWSGAGVGWNALLL